MTSPNTGNTSIDYNKLVATLGAATQKVADELARLSALPNGMEITDMFNVQMMMNNLSQLSEMSTSVVSASNSAIASMARNVKS